MGERATRFFDHVRRGCGVIILLVAISSPASAQLPSYSVTMTPANYQALFTRDIFNDDYLPAAVTDGQLMWSNAQIRFKGNSTRYYSKKSYRLRFNRSNLYYGMRQFNLNAMYTDKSFLREKLAWDLYNDIGSLAPQAFHAAYRLNGQPRGLYLWVDKVDTFFLNLRGRLVGPLYDTDDLYSSADLTIQPDSLLRLYYSWESGGVEDFSHLRNLIAAINTVDSASFPALIEQLFDMRALIDWFAVNTLTMMGDTYNKNYLLYRDTSRTTQQWVVIPWDYDLSWGRNGDNSIPYPASLLNDGFSYTFGPLPTSPSNVLKDRFKKSPVLMERLRLRLDTLLQTVFTEAHLYPRIDSLAALIQNQVILDPDKWGTYQEFRDHVEGLKYYVTARRNYLLSTFINPPTGTFNIVTRRITSLNEPIHFVAVDGRQIATMWFQSFQGLDSIRIYAHTGQVPPGIDSTGGMFVWRYCEIFRYPSNATFMATVQWMYKDRQHTDTEVGSGVQDERTLRGYHYDGSTWTQRRMALNPYVNVATFDSITQAHVGSGKYLALMVPTSYTRTWYRQPLTNWQHWYGVTFPNDTTGFVVGDHGTLMRTSNRGSTWTQFSIGLNLAFFGLATVSNSTLIAVGESGACYRSVDAGVSWTAIPLPTTNHLRAVEFASPLIGWIVGDGGTILHTTDGGLGWISQGSIDSLITLRGIVALNAASALAVGDAGTMYRTTDGGVSWSAQSSGVSVALRAIERYGSARLWAVGDSGTVIASADNGSTWFSLNVPSASVALSALSVLGDSTLFVAGGNGTVFYSRNSGATWYSQYTADSHDLNGIVFTDSARGYAVGNGGTILVTSLPGTMTDTSNPTPSIPKRFVLYQNYPNPFNPRTVIRYSLNVPGWMTMTVYNLLGQEVATLFDGMQEAGEGRVDWDASNVASGVYFYRLSVQPADGGRFSQVRKMVVIR
jgi:photosystem II stability/assembly factor-like uncharacterized protein/spore coat protein CotH